MIAKIQDATPGLEVTCALKHQTFPAEVVGRVPGTNRYVTVKELEDPEKMQPKRYPVPCPAYVDYMASNPEFKVHINQLTPKK